MSTREQLFEIAGNFAEQDCHYLENVADNGTDEQVYSALYEAEQKLEGRL